MLRFLILSAVTFFARANPADVRGTTKRFQNSLTQQNMHTVLLSIEERLRNLDSIYSMQYSPSVEGKLDHYGRKLENVEAKISRLEAVMSNELDKISENISSRNFQEDIAKDHMLRKIDSIYERINHRLIYAEIKLEMTEKKLENKLETVLSRLDRMEENMSIKDANIEMEFADVIAVIDDIKASTNVIENRIINMTDLINDTHSYSKEFIQNDQTKLSEKINGISAHLEENLKLVNDNLVTISKTNENITSELKKQFKEDFNVFANKVVDFHESSWKTYDRLESGLRSMAAVTNLTRYEIQNGLRALTVEIGRKTATNVLADSSKDQTILEELDRKIDSNFESIMGAQNLFLESCYRVQQDESQLEMKISEVLEKLIDTFEKKTSLEPKDIKYIEQLIRIHDINSRKNSHNIVNNIDTVLDKVNTNGKAVDEKLSLLRNKLDQLILIMKKNFDLCNSDRTDEVLDFLKNLQDHLFVIEAQMKNDTRANHSDVTKTEDVKTITEQLTRLSNAGILQEITIQYVKNYSNYTYLMLNELNRKISSFLDAYKEKVEKNRTWPENQVNSTFGVHPDIDRSIMEIFGQMNAVEKKMKVEQNSNNQMNDTSRYDVTINDVGAKKRNCSGLPRYDLDVRFGDGYGSNCEEMIQEASARENRNQNNDRIVFDTTAPKTNRRNCTDLEIRFAYTLGLNCPEREQLGNFQEKQTKTTEPVTDSALQQSDSKDMIGKTSQENQATTIVFVESPLLQQTDFQKGIGGINHVNSTNSIGSDTKFLETKRNCSRPPTYDIDVRYGDTADSNCSEAPQQRNQSNSKNATDLYDIASRVLNAKKKSGRNSTSPAYHTKQAGPNDGTVNPKTPNTNNGNSSNLPTSDVDVRTDVTLDRNSSNTKQEGNTSNRSNQKVTEANFGNTQLTETTTFRKLNISEILREAQMLRNCILRATNRTFSTADMFEVQCRDLARRDKAQAKQVITKANSNTNLSDTNTSTDANPKRNCSGIDNNAEAKDSNDQNCLGPIQEASTTKRYKADESDYFDFTDTVKRTTDVEKISQGKTEEDSTTINYATDQSDYELIESIRRLMDAGTENEEERRSTHLSDADIPTVTEEDDSYYDEILI